MQLGYSSALVCKIIPCGAVLSETLMGPRTWHGFEAPQAQQHLSKLRCPAQHISDVIACSLHANQAASLPGSLHGHGSRPLPLHAHMHVRTACWARTKLLAGMGCLSSAALRRLSAGLSKLDSEASMPGCSCSDATSTHSAELALLAALAGGEGGASADGPSPSTRLSSCRRRAQ